VALGASRAAVVRAHLVETMMLAAAGGVGALAITHVLGGLARRALLADIEWTASSVSPRVVAATAVIVVGVSLAVGLLPALGVSRTSPVTAMRQGARDGGGRRRGLRSGLTIVQAALSVLLLVGAGLFVRSLWNAQSLDLGIDTDRVLVVEVSRPALSRIPEGAARDAERTRRRLFFLDVLERVEALPGVERAGVAVGLPFGNRFSMPVRVPGIDELPRVNGTGPGVSAVSDDYFATIGTPILEGRAFTRADRAGAAPVSIVSEVMARTVWPGRSPIGECVIVGAAPACATIVGVAGNTHRSRLQETPYMHIYLPHGPEQGFGGAVLLVRAERPGDLAESVRRVLAASDSSVTFVRAEVLQARIDPQLQSWRLGSAVFVWSGVLALLVAAVGIYRVLSYLVADRHHEIGVRLALGARAVQVTRLVVGPGLGLSAAGVAAGLCLAALLAPLVEPLLFDHPARDPVVFGGVACVLLAVAAAASLVPAFRANRVDPLEALRAE
jgi:predicted permease